MEGAKVNVKWDGDWYPAAILRQISEFEVEVEFEDPGYPPEIVSIKDTKALDVSSNPPSIKPIAGAFNWQRFKSFFKYTVGDGDFVIPLTVQELIDLDLKSSLFSAHASERREERYGENMQELLRSLNTYQYLAFRETRRRIFCGCLQIECTPDMKHIISIDKSARAEVHPNLELIDIGHLRIAVEAWNLRNAHDAVSLDSESCKLFGDVVTTQVITTTTRFVLSRNCSLVVTVIKLDPSFGEWRKHHDRPLKGRGR
jgi:hypothetical protein